MRLCCIKMDKRRLVNSLRDAAHMPPKCDGVLAVAKKTRMVGIAQKCRKSRWVWRIDTSVSVAVLRKRSAAQERCSLLFSRVQVSSCFSDSLVLPCVVERGERRVCTLETCGANE